MTQKQSTKLTAAQRVFAAAEEENATEHAIQSAAFLAFRAIDDHRVRWVHAIPNGGDRNAVVAGMMIKEGVKRGIWDISFPFWSGKHPFGYVEMKRPKYRNEPNGGLTTEQSEFRAHLIQQNAFFRVCYSWQEALQALKDYLDASKH